MVRPTARVLGVAVCAALALSACGDDGDDREPAGAPTPAWEEVDGRLTALADRTSILAAEVGDDGSLRVVHERDADEIAPLGSVFKLYVLGALVDAVGAGDLEWDRPVVVEEADVSLGRLAARVGEAVALQEAATLMISESDNTANDVVMRTIGRGAVEAALEPMGMGAASRARTLPFLTAREAFLVKWGSRAAEYAEADESGRRAILAELDEPMPDLSAVDPTDPAEIDRVEWFATAREVAAAHVWLDEVRTGPGGSPLDEILGSDNPGLALDRATWPRGAFKGGSEPGVLALSWLLERSDGRRVVLVLLSSSPTSTIDERAAATVADDAIELLAEGGTAAVG
jgi:hypothetical protein